MYQYLSFIRFALETLPQAQHSAGANEKLFYVCSVAYADVRMGGVSVCVLCVAVYGSVCVYVGCIIKTLMTLLKCAAPCRSKADTDGAVWLLWCILIFEQFY